MIVVVVVLAAGAPAAPPPGHGRGAGVAALSSTSAPLSAQSLSALEAPPAGGASGAPGLRALPRPQAGRGAWSASRSLLVFGFVIFSLIPSDPVETLTRGRPTSAKQMAFLIKQLGLNQPVWERFGHFVLNTVQGHLGYSWQFETPVATLIAQRLWPTLLLMGSSTIISVVLGHVARHPQRLAAGQPAGPCLDRVRDHVLVGADVLARDHPARAVQHRLRADPGAVPGGRHVDAGHRGRPHARAHPRRRSGTWYCPA